MSEIMNPVQATPFAVDYEVKGARVKMDLNFVKRYLVRGSAQVSDQEALLFLATCRDQKLNPFLNEVYLIKYNSNDTAQVIVARNAYLRRAYENPEYLGLKFGVTVQRKNGEIVQKEGTCLYPGETLIGGWARVYHTHNGKEVSTFEECAFAEYNKGKSTWRQMPATMISKVAQAHVLRMAFPSDFAGLYSEDEMVASGAIPANAVQAASAAPQLPGRPAETVVDERTISQEQRQALFKMAQNAYGKEQGNRILKAMVRERGMDSTADMPLSKYNQIMQALMDRIEKERKEKEKAPTQEAPAPEQEPAPEAQEAPEEVPAAS